VTEIAHVAIAVSDLDAVISWYEATLGARLAIARGSRATGSRRHRSVSPSRSSSCTPISDTSPVARLLERKGEGIYHVGYRVRDCAAAIEQMRAVGATLIDEHPRLGSRGTPVAIFHPRSTLGTPIELVQP
jgi:methylmalonyl-CoA/ethylmalonyl-CoA epimerase